MDPEVKASPSGKDESEVSILRVCDFSQSYSDFQVFGAIDIGLFLLRSLIIVGLLGYVVYREV
jgi:hypothetical protein